MRFQGLPEYPALCDKHAQFHRAVSEIIQLAKTGNQERAHALMKPGSPFVELSHETVGLIKTLAQKTAAHG